MGVFAETAAQAWSPWFVGAWVVWLGAFAVLEWVGLRRDHDRYPPLTQVVVRWVPVVVTIAGLVWLLAHAWESYR